jgi:hypothetical protein
MDEYTSINEFIEKHVEDNKIVPGMPWKPDQILH